MSLTDVITNSCGIPWIPWCESFGWHCLTFFNSLAFVRLLGTWEQGWRGHASYFWWIVQQFCPSGNKSEKWRRAILTLKSIEPEMWCFYRCFGYWYQEHIVSSHYLLYVWSGMYVVPSWAPLCNLCLSPTGLMAEEIPVLFIPSHSAFG